MGRCVFEIGHLDEIKIHVVPVILGAGTGSSKAWRQAR